MAHRINFLFIYNKKEKNISKKFATLLKLHIGIDNDGFIRVNNDQVNIHKLKEVFEEELPDYEDSNTIIRYTEHVQKNIAALLEDSEKMFNFKDVF